MFAFRETANISRASCESVVVLVTCNVFCQKSVQVYVVKIKMVGELLLLFNFICTLFIIVTWLSLLWDRFPNNCSNFKYIRRMLATPTTSSCSQAGKRGRYPQTQKFCCWLTPTRDSHTGQPDREVQWPSLTMEVPPSWSRDPPSQVSLCAGAFRDIIPRYIKLQVVRNRILNSCRYKKGHIREYIGWGETGSDTNCLAHMSARKDDGCNSLLILILFPLTPIIFP